MKNIRKYNLFLDDVREVTMIYTYRTHLSFDFVVVRSYDEFISCIKQNGPPGFISFDNDLGEDKDGNLLPDGYACAKWLVYESGLDISGLSFFVHSSNPVAKEQIKGLLDNYIEYLKKEKA